MQLCRYIPDGLAFAMTEGVFHCLASRSMEVLMVQLAMCQIEGTDILYHICFSVLEEAELMLRHMLAVLNCLDEIYF